jgi:phosphoribosyl-ATP pyrophosphohydrolase/phosphoribosyl-AMP cyclohydrolase
MERIRFRGEKRLCSDAIMGGEGAGGTGADGVAYDERGLVPVVVQDHLTGEVRMVAYANAEALGRTLATGSATFWSRSRGELWEKGATSGHRLRVHRVLADCDADCLVYSVEPVGPSCHTGTPSCFFRTLALDAPGQAAQRVAFGGDVDMAVQTLFGRLEATLEARKASDAGKSYTKSLYEGGAEKIGKKLREEADELARAVAGETDERVASEAADVVYHLLVGLRHRGVAWREVCAVLEQRFGTSGHAEKAARPKP